MNDAPTIVDRPGGGDVAITALAAVSVLPEDRATLYWDVILAALPPSVRKALEAQMQGYVYQSEFARKYYSQGREEGRKEGREEGRVEGREEGRVNALRESLLALVRAKLEAVTSEDVAAIEALRDKRVLIELVGVLGRATSALEIRSALAAARTDG